MIHDLEYISEITTQIFFGKTLENIMKSFFFQTLKNVHFSARSINPQKPQLIRHSNKKIISLTKVRPICGQSVTAFSHLFRSKYS